MADGGPPVPDLALRSLANGRSPVSGLRPSLVGSLRLPVGACVPRAVKGGRGSGVVGYNVQVAVDTENHLIVTHEVTNTGSDRSQLGNVAKSNGGAICAAHC